MRNFILTALLLTFQVTLLAQSRFDGSWQGTISFGQEVKMIINITTDGDNASATLNVPAQGAIGIKSAETNINEDSITISFKQPKAIYTGKLIDATRIEGKWKQGLPMPLNFEKMDKPFKLNRPQEPKPPFSYSSEDVTYANADQSVKFGATITYPNDDKKHPAIILISGSGQQNRDEELFGHNPFFVIADHLTKNGYVVLRVDDRAAGETTGDLKIATSYDFAKDVMASLDYLKTRKEVDKKKIGLLGHSEGGMIAPIVATERPKDIDFIILTAGPGVKIAQLMTEQNEATLISMGIKESWAKSYSNLYYEIVSLMQIAKDKNDYADKVNSAITTWRDTANKVVVMNSTGITDSTTQKRFAKEFIKLYENAWMRYFIKYDPKPVLEQLSCKVLALNGEKDIQVLPKSNLTGIKAALANSKSKSYEVKEIAGVNHLFQECNTCTVKEYLQIEQTIKPDVLDIITDWLDEHVK